MMKMIRTLGVLCGMALMTACSSLPRYQPPPAGPDVAMVDLSRINANAICTGGELYDIGPVEDNMLPVPTDSRVALYGWVYISDYYASYSCMPGISFQPEPGVTYLMNLELESKSCRAEVYRTGADNRVGLDVVPSVGPPSLCR